MDVTIKLQYKENKVYVVCEEANINQIFLVEDLPELIKDLPNLIDNKI